VRSIQALSQWQDLPAHWQSAGPGNDGFPAVDDVTAGKPSLLFAKLLEPVRRDSQDRDPLENVRYRRSYSADCQRFRRR